jgi:glycerol-3-phosphate dehydrogenase
MTRSLQRDLDSLTARTCDVLVIGGGIYGLTIACDAAQRGLSVVLIERNDFGSGTSFNHLRTIHGGLRYLQTLDFARARESVRERRTLARIAPWAVRPLPFVLPLQRSVTKGRAAMSLGLLLDRVVAADRNEGVPASHRLPAGRVLDRAAAQREFPEIDGDGVTGAAVWHDYVTTDADRLTLAWGSSAAEHGAMLANYVEATSLLSRDGSAVGATARDRISGCDLRIEARTVVNATGARLNTLLSPCAAHVTLPLLMAMNVVSTRPALRVAFGGRGHSGRTLFVVPWRGRSLFGTWESGGLCGPDDLTVPRPALEMFLDDVNSAFPTAHLTVADVSMVHRGIVPALVHHGVPTIDGGELVFEHRAEGLSGLVSVAGTKYTTARGVASRIVDRLYQFLGRPLVPSRSDSVPLPHVDLEGDALLQHAARHEMVVTLADAVMRRTTIGATGCPDAQTLSHAAEIVGTELAWPADRQRDEIEAVRRVY